jgi:hypothetical protein
VGVVVLVGRPFYDVVACFLKGRNNNFDTAKDRWMREDLAQLILGYFQSERSTYDAVIAVVSKCEPTGRDL